MDDDFMNIAKNEAYFPAEAYLFFPKPHTVKCTEAQRMVFDGNTQFNDDELQMIEKFKAYVDNQKFKLAPMWTDSLILRFLYAASFKMNRTLTSIKEHTIWRETFLPIQLDDPNSGLIYVHGRDNQFRPIVIFNLYKVDPKKIDIDLILRVLTFWLEYVINEWMLPGQIETWKFVANMKGMGVATLAMQSMRKLFACLQDNYKCRLCTLYVLNVTPAMYIPYQVVKTFLDDVTVQKIQIYKTQIPTTLFNTTNREQVEQKFGGTAPDATQFWPPIVPSNNYFVAPDDSKALITKEKYTTLVNSGSLRNMRVNKSLTVMPQVQVVAQDEDDRDNVFNQKNHRGNHRVMSSMDPVSAIEPLNLGNSSFAFQPEVGSKSATFGQAISPLEEDADYLHYMDENVSAETKKARASLRTFEANFISKFSRY